MRLPELHPSDLGDEQRALQAAIARTRGASAQGGPFAIWLHNPRFGLRVQEFGAYVRYSTSLQPRHSELAILACARHWMAQYEWWVHAPIALQAGMAPSVLEAIRTGASPSFDEPTDAAVYRFCQELLGNRKVSDEAFGEIEAALKAEALIELVGLIGYYSLVAMTLLAFEAEPPSDGGTLFRPME
jgi:4-carboxymuconolactone decarboxylase